jgi:hypothetical protein
MSIFKLEKIPWSSVCGCLPKFWSCFWCQVPPSAQWGGHKKANRAQCQERMAGYSWERGSHALEVEELPCYLAWDVHRPSSWSNYCAWSCGLKGLVVLALFLWLARITLWHKGCAKISSGLASGDASSCIYTINGHDYTMGYYLADDIYISWSTFLKTIWKPKTNIEIVFARLKKHAKRTLRELSACCKLGLQLFETLLISGTWSPSKISWRHAWFYTTWSSRMRGIWTWNVLQKYW